MLQETVVLTSFIGSLQRKTAGDDNVVRMRWTADGTNASHHIGDTASESAVSTTEDIVAAVGLKETQLGVIQARTE